MFCCTLYTKYFYKFKFYTDIYYNMYTENKFTAFKSFILHEIGHIFR